MRQNPNTLTAHVLGEDLIVYYARTFKKTNKYRVYGDINGHPIEAEQPTIQAALRRWEYKATLHADKP